MPSPIGRQHQNPEAELRETPGTPAWEAHFGELDLPAEAFVVTFDDGGNVLAAGYTHRAGDFAYGTVAKLAPDGALLWKGIDERGSEVQSRDVVAGGDVIVGGTTNAKDETDNGQPTVTKLDGETGAVRWRHADHASLHCASEGLTDADGNVVLELRRRRAGRVRSPRCPILSRVM